MLSYITNREILRPGDVVAFSGNQPISWLIRLWSGSVLSHMGVVRQGVAGIEDATMTHSTLEAGQNGAGTVPLGRYLADYAKEGGSASALLLSDGFREAIDWQKFYAYIGAAEGYVRYDVEGLFGFLGRELPVIGPYICQAPDPAQAFCDAYVISIFEAAGALRGINPRKMMPQDVAEMGIYCRAVPLVGQPIRIRRFNSL